MNFCFLFSPALWTQNMNLVCAKCLGLKTCEKSQNLECTLECSFNITILAHEKHTPPKSPCLCYVCLNLKSFFDAQKRPLKFESCPTSSWKLFGKHIASGTASLKASPKDMKLNTQLLTIVITLPEANNSHLKFDAWTDFQVRTCC